MSSALIRAWIAITELLLDSGMDDLPGEVIRRLRSAHDGLKKWAEKENLL